MFVLLTVDPAEQTVLCTCCIVFHCVMTSLFINTSPIDGPSLDFFALINSEVISIKYMSLIHNTLGTFLLGDMLARDGLVLGGHNHSAFQKVLCVPRWLFNLSVT